MPLHSSAVRVAPSLWQVGYRGRAPCHAEIAADKPVRFG
jgi:hypothetical protein